MNKAFSIFFAIWEGEVLEACLIIFFKILKFETHLPIPNSTLKNHQIWKKKFLHVHGLISKAKVSGSPPYVVTGCYYLTIPRFPCEETRNSQTRNSLWGKNEKKLAFWGRNCSISELKSCIFCISILVFMYIFQYVGNYLSNTVVIEHLTSSFRRKIFYLNYRHKFFIPHRLWTDTNLVEYESMWVSKGQVKSSRLKYGQIVSRYANI